MRALLDLAYRLQKRLWRLVRPSTRGVKVMLFADDGGMVLIRNSYGRSDLFVLPGGGVHPFEDPAVAAVREVREELGCGVADLALVSTHANGAEGKRDMVTLYRGRAVGTPVADGFEVAEAAVFALDALPASVSPATLRRIEEHLGRRSPDGLW